MTVDQSNESKNFIETCLKLEYLGEYLDQRGRKQYTYGENYVMKNIIMSSLQLCLACSIQGTLDGWNT